MGVVLQLGMILSIVKLVDAAYSSDISVLKIKRVSVSIQFWRNHFSSVVVSALNFFSDEDDEVLTFSFPFSFSFSFQSISFQLSFSLSSLKYHWRIRYRSRWNGFEITTSRGTVCDSPTASWSDTPISCTLNRIYKWSASIRCVIQRGGATTTINTSIIFHRRPDSRQWLGAPILTLCTSPIRFRRSSEDLGRCWKVAVCTPKWGKWFLKLQIWLNTCSRTNFPIQPLRQPCLNQSSSPSSSPLSSPVTPSLFHSKLKRIFSKESFLP